MKINDVTGGKGPSQVRRKKADGGKGGEFADALKEASGTGESSGTVAAGSVQAVDAVLAMQETDDATDRRSRGLARDYGESLLDRLDQIRHDLLMGAVPKDRLADLARTMRSQRRSCNDPAMMAIIDDIELRCEVEIAKLSRGR